MTGCQFPKIVKFEGFNLLWTINALKESKVKKVKKTQSHTIHPNFIKYSNQNPLHHSVSQNYLLPKSDLPLFPKRQLLNLLEIILLKLWPFMLRVTNLIHKFGFLLNLFGDWLSELILTSDFILNFYPIRSIH